MAPHFDPPHLHVLLAPAAEAQLHVGAAAQVDHKVHLVGAVGTPRHLALRVVDSHLQGARVQVEAVEAVEVEVPVSQIEEVAPEEFGEVGETEFAEPSIGDAESYIS